jgi:hypothetical protein
MDLLYGRADTILEVEIERPSQPGKRHSVVVRRQPSPKKKSAKATSPGRRSPATELLFGDNLATRHTDDQTPVKVLASPSHSAAEQKGAAQQPSLTHIDMDSQLRGASGVGTGEASWDPEDGCGSIGRSNSSDSTRFDPYGKHAGDGRNGVGGSSAERLAADNLRLIGENEQLKLENAQLKEMVARLRVRLEQADAAGEEEDGEEEAVQDVRLDQAC